MAIDARTLATDIASTCSTWRELDPAVDAHLAADGLLPGLWCEPGSAEELAAVLRAADENGAAVIPRGGGSRMGLGFPPRAADLLLSTRGLNRVVEYEPADLTVTVEAGLGLADLQRRVGADRQFLALDPPTPQQATLGGVVASNASGPLRLQYGSARDLVIGTRVANPDGTLTRAGGRVVKNVAGYDLNKLYTGSLGALGVIVELSFKLHPLPPALGTVLAVFEQPADVAEVVRRVMRSPLGPSALEVLNRAAAEVALPDLRVPAEGCALAVLVGGFESAVARATRDIAGFCRESGAAETLAEPGSESLWSSIRDLPDASDPQRPLLKLALPPAHSVDAFARFVSSLDGRGFEAVLLAHAGSGIVYARLQHRDWSSDELERLAALVADTRSFALECGGSLVVECCPTPLKQLVDVWGEIGPAWKLMRSLKDKLDPAGTLNPGRYVGGI